MVRTTEGIVDILRRCGPGALPESQLLVEMHRRKPSARISRARLRSQVRAAGDRLLLLEVKPDAIEGSQSPDPLDSWIVLTCASDAPDQTRLAALLWSSLAALAAEVDPASRTSVSRWVGQAYQAQRVHDLLGGRID